MKIRYHIFAFFAFVFICQGCSVLDHHRTQDLYNDAVKVYGTDYVQASELFERVVQRTENTYHLNEDKETAHGKAIDLSGLGAFFGLVVTPEPDLKANAMFMLAESHLQLGNYNKAKLAASVGLKEPKKGSIDTMMMRLIIPRVIIRETMEKLGYGPAAFRPGIRQNFSPKINMTGYEDLKVNETFEQAYIIIDRILKDADLEDYSADVRAIPLREKIRLLRQWETAIASISLTGTAVEMKNKHLENQWKALKKINIVTENNTRAPFPDAYCPIRNLLDPNISPGVSWIRNDVDRLLSGSNRAGENPCSKWEPPK